MVRTANTYNAIICQSFVDFFVRHQEVDKD